MSLTKPTAGRVTERFSYDGSGNPEYLGRAYSTPAGTVSTAVAQWQIRRVTWSGGNATVIEWAGGTDKFIHVWDDRATLSYR